MAEKQEKEPSKDGRAITKEMTLGEVIRKYPSSAAVMMEYGLHCIGCHVAEWESIEEGCLAHGISKEEIDKLVDELNTDKILEGRLVVDDKEQLEENIQEQMENEKKGFFRRLHK